MGSERWTKVLGQLKEYMIENHNEAFLKSYRVRATPTAATPRRKGFAGAVDHVIESLGKREPDLDEKELVVDKVTPTVATPRRKGFDDAVDHLIESLGQREPDLDEKEPVVDKVKEKVKSEHTDKTGERDDTIPPEHRQLLDSDEKPSNTASRRENTININHYATKKSVAESMLDVALLMANATQLKAVLEQGNSFQYYGVLIALIGVSLFFQVAIGILLIIMARLNLNDVTKQQRLDLMNNIATILVFVTVVFNILISAFSMQTYGLYPSIYGRRLY